LNEDYESELHIFRYFILNYFPGGNKIKINSNSGKLIIRCSMSLRVAVASSDGKYINQHFGHAKLFIIFDLDDEGRFEFVETRENVPSCSGGDHSLGGLESTINILRDVDIVLISQIGPGATQSLLSNNIQPYIMPGFIDEKLKKLSDALCIKKPK
jgi:nitrogen fixation protein NifX